MVFCYAVDTSFHSVWQYFTRYDRYVYLRHLELGCLQLKNGARVKYCQVRREGTSIAESGGLGQRENRCRIIPVPYGWFTYYLSRSVRFAPDPLVSDPWLRYYTLYRGELHISAVAWPFFPTPPFWWRCLLNRFPYLSSHFGMEIPRSVSHLGTRFSVCASAGCWPWQAH